MLVAQLCPTLIPQTVACQAPLSMGFSRQEHWSGLPFPPREDLPDPGIEPQSSAGRFFTLGDDRQMGEGKLFVLLIVPMSFSYCYAGIKYTLYP